MWVALLKIIAYILKRVKWETASWRSYWVPRLTMLYDSEGTCDGEGNSTGASSSLTASTMDTDRTLMVLPS